MTLFASLKSFIADEDGATAIEYGLIAALVSVAAIAALGALGGSLESLFSTISSSINGVLPE
jgi:pilus assembly protein Flp/PilA